MCGRSLSAHHTAVDGRSGFMILDKVLEFLRDEIDGRGEDLRWGEEVCRLPMAPEVIWAVHETGKPEPPAEPSPMKPLAPEGEVTCILEFLE